MQTQQQYEKPQFAMMSVSPETARRWLQRNDSNRSIRRARVSQYARDMRDGNWTFSNDAICFSIEGRLLNGQHRLNAVVEAGVPVTILVGKNIPESSMTTMDTGAARTPGDALHLTGHKNANILASTAKFLIIYERDLLSANTAHYRVSNSEIAEFIEAYPQIEWSVDFAGKNSRHIDCGPSPVAIAHFLIAGRCGQEVANDYLGALASRVGLEEGDPVIAVDNRLRILRTNKSRPAVKFLVDLLIRGFNHRQQGKAIKSLQLKSGTAFVLATPKVVSS